MRNILIRIITAALIDYVAVVIYALILFLITNILISTFNIQFTNNPIVGQINISNVEKSI